ncbi:MAG: 50S ribosomal protein L4 [Chlamydiae bacterium]|nr:50S ribosomal protein L4 [Chlamydiota bacterium]
MATLKKINLKGEEVGELIVEDSFLEVDGNRQMIKDYIVALRANRRQWSASTKGRSEVNHTKRKPYKQKGTGNARQGSLAAPQFKGGGVVFGPKPKFDQHVRINQKERRLASRTLLKEKIEQNHLVLVEDASFSSEFSAPKTQTVAQFLKGQKLSGKRILFVGEASYEEVDVLGEMCKISTPCSKHGHFKKSVRNIPKSTFVQAANVNGYDLISVQEIVMTESALKQLMELWK